MLYYGKKDSKQITAVYKDYKEKTIMTSQL